MIAMTAMTATTKKKKIRRMNCLLPLIQLQWPLATCQVRRRRHRRRRKKVPPRKSSPWTTRNSLPYEQPHRHPSVQSPTLSSPCRLPTQAHHTKHFSHESFPPSSCQDRCLEINSKSVWEVIGSHSRSPRVLLLVLQYNSLSMHPKERSTLPTMKTMTGPHTPVARRVNVRLARPC